MKKDIDLLNGFNEAKNKKSSSSSSLIMVLAVFLLIGVMLFMYMNLNKQLELKQQEFDQNDAKKIALEASKVPTQTEVTNKNEAYTKLVTEVLKRLYQGKYDTSSPEISAELFEILFDNYIDKYHDGIVGGKKIYRVLINSVSVSGQGEVTISCASRTREDAWDYVEYLSGDATDPPISERTTGYVPTPDDTKLFGEQVLRNGKLFEGVQANYPGLPSVDESEEYNVVFNLTFKVKDWGELRDEYQAN